MIKYLSTLELREVRVMFGVKRKGNIIEITMNPAFQASWCIIKNGYERMGYVECDEKGNPLNAIGKPTIKW